MPDVSASVRVPLAQRTLGALFARRPGLGLFLDRLETRALAAEGTPLPAIERPVYVCGMARSGSTLLLETLHLDPQFAAHHYSDYPLLWTPVWWNRLRSRLPRGRAAPAERAHGDRLAVTPDSPEAFEEPFWQHFFPGRHDPSVDQVLEAAHRNAAFDAFYRTHVAKLLLARGARRYLAKANYDLTRLGYLVDLFPDARFVIPVREPTSHVESLVRQDRRFCALAAASPAIGAHLVRVGHREFGPGKRPINVGDDAQAQAIAALHATGDTVQAYALQWAALHGWLLRRLERDPALARACLIVPYDALCGDPAGVLGAVCAHAGVDPATTSAIVARMAPQVSAPDYYRSSLDAAAVAGVKAATGAVWRALRQARGALQIL